jgi:hypothetical protein
VIIKLTGFTRSTLSINVGSLDVEEDTKAVWDSPKTDIDKTTAPADTTQFCPVEGGNFAEKGARMVIMFRLAKMICKDGHWLHIRLPKVLGGGLLPVDGMMEGCFITEFLEGRA